MHCIICGTPVAWDGSGALTDGDKDDGSGYARLTAGMAGWRHTDRKDHRHQPRIFMPVGMETLDTIKEALGFSAARHLERIGASA